MDNGTPLPPLPAYCQGFQPKALTWHQWITCWDVGRARADIIFPAPGPDAPSNRIASQAGDYVYFVIHHALPLVAVAVLVVVLLCFGVLRRRTI
jgi:hypothetical protein